MDLLIEAGVEYVAFNPGATFRGIHDSLTHRPGAPAIILCTHEEVAVSLAHGYAKAAGRPMAVLLHDLVGLQHATMAIYNAWCDRAPILLIGGSGPASTAKRRPWIDWIHTADVQAQQVRDYVKWDDQPADAASIPMAFARAWRTAAASPPGPVYLCLDAAIQEERFEGWEWPGLDAFPAPASPAPAREGVQQLASWLRDAQLPVLVTDYAGADARGFDALVALAEATGAPVIDRGARMSFPSHHELNFSALAGETLAAADAVIAVDVEDLHGALGDLRPERVADITVRHLKQRSWSHDFQALPAVDLLLTAAAQPALEAILEELAAEPVPNARLVERRRRTAGRSAAQRALDWEGARAAVGASSVSASRVMAELWPLLENQRFVVTHGRPTGFERRLWRFEHAGQHMGWHGGAGQGYGVGASIGVALAAPRGTICVDLQADGDLLYTASGLWTAAHLRVGLLIVVLNNRQYGNTVGHSRQIAALRGRVTDRSAVGGSLEDPAVDFAGLARSFGMWSTGPIGDPHLLHEPLRDAIAVVRDGRPALVEVLVPGV